MVIKVLCKTVQTPRLFGSPLALPDRYYEVDSVPQTERVVQDLRGTIKDLDPSSVVVEQTDLDANELRKQGITIFKRSF